MERRTLLARLAGAVGAWGALRATPLFGDNSKEKLQKTGAMPCVLPSGGPRAGYFPNVVLINQDFVKGRFYDDLVAGKTVIFSTFATTNLSRRQNQVLANLLELQKVLGNRLGRGIFLYSITFDPEHDTPQVLHAFAQRLGIRSDWSLLTGRPEDINSVLARLGLGYMKVGRHVMPPHFGILRIGNEALDRWTTMPAVYEPPMILEHLSLVEVKPERKDTKGFVRAGPSPRNVAEFEPGKTAANATSAREIR